MFAVSPWLIFFWFIVCWSSNRHTSYISYHSWFSVFWHKMYLWPSPKRFISPRSWYPYSVRRKHPKFSNLSALLSAFTFCSNTRFLSKIYHVAISEGIIENIIRRTAQKAQPTLRICRHSLCYWFNYQNGKSAFYAVKAMIELPTPLNTAG